MSPFFPAISRTVRPEELGVEVRLERATATYDRAKRLRRTWHRRGVYKAVVASVSPQERLRYQQLQHPVTHNLLFHPPFPAVLPGDRLVLASGTRIYYVQTVADPGEQGIILVLGCQERPDQPEQDE